MTDYPKHDKMNETVSGYPEQAREKWRSAMTQTDAGRKGLSMMKRLAAWLLAVLLLLTAAGTGLAEDEYRLTEDPENGRWEYQDRKSVV